MNNEYSHEPTDDEKRWLSEAREYLGTNPKDEGVESLVKFRAWTEPEDEQLFERLLQDSELPACVWGAPIDVYDPKNSSQDEPEYSGIRCFYKN